MQTSEAVAQFLASRRARGLSEQTIKWYGQILNRFGRQFPELPETPEQLESFLAAATAGDERRHGYFRALRAFYRWLERRDKIANKRKR